MKIVYLHQYFKTNENNGGTRSYEFAKYLVEQGHEVFMITGEKCNKDIIDGIKIISTGTKYDNKMNKFKRIKSFFDYIIKSSVIGIKIKDVELVFATSTPLTIGVPALIIKNIKKAKMIFEVRDVWPDIPVELGFIKNKILISLLKNFERICYKNANHIIALSEGMASNIVSKGISEKKVTTITNIANLSLYDKQNINKKNIKKNLGLEEKFICIHPGTMGFVNNLEYILNVAERTRDKEIVYLLIGEGKEKDKLLKIKKEKGLDNVIIKNSLPKMDIIDVIKSSDIGIMCVGNYRILEDNSANKFFDFLAAGLPIMINYAGWQANALKMKNAGFNFGYYEPEKMAEKIEQLKNDNELTQYLGENSRKLANEYSLEKALQSLNKIIIECEGF